MARVAQRDGRGARVDVESREAATASRARGGQDRGCGAIALAY